MAANTVVLDSWALLAYLFSEPSAQHVRQLLSRARRGQVRVLLSIINFGECLYMSERRAGTERTLLIAGYIDQLSVEIVDADRELVLQAAHLKATNKFSYADAFAAALALRYKATLMTGDLEFKTLEERIRIHWLTR